MFGSAAAFRLPPVDNLLRLIPVLKVTDNRRMTLWLAFGLVTLGGFGIDRLGVLRTSRWWRGWLVVCTAGSILALGSAGTIRHFAPLIRSRAETHYAHAAELTPGADPTEYHARAERQTAATLRFVPRYLATIGVEGLILAGLVAAYRRGKLTEQATQAGLFGITLLELVSFGFDLNPAIDPAEDRPTTRLIADLQRDVGQSGRVIGLGAEFPPNALMRYGLLDARNYDSVETRRNLDWFRQLYDPAVAAQSSRREISWDRVARSRELLRIAGVKAVVGPSKPPTTFRRVQRYEAVWVAWLDDAEPLITLDGPGRITRQQGQDGQFEVDLAADGPVQLLVRETYDPGWVADVDGVVTVVEPDRGAFLKVGLGRGQHHIRLKYDPAEVRVASLISLFATLAIVFALTGILDLRSSGSVVPRLGRIQAFG